MTTLSNASLIAALDVDANRAANFGGSIHFVPTTSEADRSVALFEEAVRRDLDSEILAITTFNGWNFAFHVNEIEDTRWHLPR